MRSTLLTALMNRFSSPETIIIQIADNTITLSRLNKKNGQPEQVLIYNVENLELHQGEIFNPTKLHALIESYTQSHQIQRYTIIIYSVATANPFHLLQHLLVFGKKGTVVKAVYDSPYTMDQNSRNNAANLLLTILPQGYHTLYLWVVSALLIMTTSLLCMGFINHQKTTLDNNISDLSVMSKACTHDIKEQKAKNTLLEKNNTLLEEQNIYALKNASYNRAPLALLLTISSLLPIHSILSSFSLGKGEDTAMLGNSQPSPQISQPPDASEHIPLCLRGLTNNPQEIADFARALSQQCNNMSFVTRKTKNAQSIHSSPSFSHNFTISGFYRCP